MCTDAAADLLSCLWFNVETKQVSFAPHLWGLSSLTAPLKGDMSLTNSALLSKQRVVKHMIGGSLEETWSQAQSAFASAQQLTFSFAHSRHGYRWTQKDKATHMCEHPRVASTCSRCCRDSVTHMGSSERECVYIVGACVRSAIGEESAGFNEPFVQQWGRSDVWICSPRAKCAVEGGVCGGSALKDITENLSILIYPNKLVSRQREDAGRGENARWRFSYLVANVATYFPKKETRLRLSHHQVFFQVTLNLFENTFRKRKSMT